MKFRLNDHVSLTEVDDEAVLLDLDAGAYFGLNHVGARFLSAVIGGDSVEIAVANIAREFDVESSVVQSDINELIAQLQSQNLINAES